MFLLILLLASLLVTNTINKNKQTISTKAAPPQIIGGHPADPGEWPFMVALYDYREKDENKIRDANFCGGFLISNELILTAAHCLYKFSDDTFLYRTEREKAEVGVAIGYNNLRDKKDSKKLLTPIESYFIYPGFNYKFQYKKLISDEDFTRDGLYNNDDIALLKIKKIKGLNFIKYKSISLSKDYKMISPGTPITVLGWGDTEVKNDVLPDILYEGSNTIYSNKRLVKYENKNIYDNKILVENFPNTNFGDSGSPIITYSLTLKKWFVIGVATWMDPANKKSYFTNLIYHLPWIKQITGIDVGKGTFFGSPPD